MEKLKLIVLSLLTPLILMGAMPASAGAFSLFGDACNSTDKAKDSPACQQAKNEGGDTNNRVTGPKNIINVAANILALVTGIAAVIMIIVSGLTMVISAGNSESFKAAQHRLTGAVVGLIVVALAWIIIRFVTDKLIQ
jgi:hypothetical protein